MADANIGTAKLTIEVDAKDGAARIETLKRGVKDLSGEVDKSGRAGQ